MSGSIIEIINRFGVMFCDNALKVLFQSSILIAVLLVVDLLIRKRVKAVFRYCIWLLVFVKLIIPPTFSLPTGIGYWLGDIFPEKAIQTESAPKEMIERPRMEYSIKPLTPPRLVETQNHLSLQSNLHMPVMETPVIIPEASSIKVHGIIFLLWIVGEMIFIALLLQRILFVRRIIAQSKPASDNLQDILAESCRKIGIKKKIELKVSQGLLSPAACGLLKPKIILPSSLLKCFSQEKLHTTLLHELAHIKRKDIWINSLQSILQILYFYNPLLWIANTIVRRIREQAVDETVLVYLGEQADTYSKTLVDIVEIAFAKPSLGLNMIGVVESKKALTNRIKHILSRPFPKTVKLGVTGFIAIILSALVLLPMAKAEKEKKSPESSITSSQTDIQPANQSNVTPPVWITFLPASPIRSLTDYEHSQKVESLSSEDGKVQTYELEIRSASDNKRIARIKYDNYPISGGRWGCKLNKEQIQEIGAIKDGTYLAAMYVNGVRCSNVAQFTVDSNADLSSKPVLKLVPLPLGVEQVLPGLGIIATGPNPTNPELMQSAIYFPDLFVDGIERKPNVIKWAGSDRVLQAGTQGVAIIDLDNYSPAIELNQPHEVWAKLGKYQSAAVVIPASDTAGKNWDEITENFYPTSAPVVMLEGIIIGPEGKPVSYNVSLIREDGKVFETSSNSDGNYEFFNLPIGKYQLRCNPPKLGAPTFFVNNIQIREGQKASVNPDLTNQYSFSGKISYEDGSPAANMDVMATWEDGQNEFWNSIKTDERGQYRFSSPFEIASYVGVGSMQAGYITPRQPYRNLKAGRDDVNFVLKKASETNTASDKFTAVLPNGVTVELVGVCEHPSAGKQWWKPDGSILEKAPYEKTDRIRDANDSEKIREFALRFGGSYSGDARHLISGLDGEKQAGIGARLNYINQNLPVITAIFSKDKKSTTVPLQVSAGQWETRAVGDGRREVSIAIFGGETIYQEASEENGKSIIPIIVRSILGDDGSRRWDNRIIAKDMMGKELIGRQFYGGIRGRSGWYRYEFDVPLDQIVSFEYQIRPYYQIDFENVSLEPGEKTNVQIQIKEAGKNLQTDALIPMESQPLEKISTNTLPVWITYLAASPIRSLADYQHSQEVESLSSEDGKVQTCELEIRSASDNKRIARITYDNYPISGGRWGCKLNKEQIQKIGAVKGGTYLAAMYVNGIRCSNAAQFTVDSNADLSSKPVLKLVPLPLGIGQQVRILLILS
jgi:beta-lactamase regulating signal transducer with metallopeptidase domain